MVEGVPASPSGFQASPGAAGASPPSVSIPNAADWLPIAELSAIADETYERWDKDMRSGKLMIALSGDMPRYRSDVTSVRLACATAPGMLSTLRAVNILARRQGVCEHMDADVLLKSIRDLTTDDSLARMFAEMPAQAIEARRAAIGTGAVHESAVGETDAPEPSRPSLSGSN